jgi:hypothetical protein
VISDWPDFFISALLGNCHNAKHRAKRPSLLRLKYFGQVDSQQGEKPHWQQSSSASAGCCQCYKQLQVFNQPLLPSSTYNIERTGRWKGFWTSVHCFIIKRSVGWVRFPTSFSQTLWPHTFLTAITTVSRTGLSRLCFHTFPINLSRLWCFQNHQAGDATVAVRTANLLQLPVLQQIITWSWRSMTFLEP